MNRKLADWASIAEVVSGIAVVVTLIFLLVGIRENTSIARASAYQTNMDSLNEWRAMLIEQDLNEAWNAYMDSGVQSEEKQADIGVANLMLFAIFEKSFYSRDYGILGEQEWGRFENQICMRARQLIEAGNPFAFSREVLTGRFVDYIEETCRLFD